MYKENLLKKEMDTIKELQSQLSSHDYNYNYDTSITSECAHNSKMHHHHQMRKIAIDSPRKRNNVNGNEKPQLKDKISGSGQLNLSPKLEASSPRDSIRLQLSPSLHSENGNEMDIAAEINLTSTMDETDARIEKALSPLSVQRDSIRFTLTKTNSIKGGNKTNNPVQASQMNDELKKKNSPL